MKMLLKTNNRRWELYCRIESYLQLQRERERERETEKVYTTITYGVVMLK
jgi:hypothetical protein